jgi:tetratricopeptide (TPR) repeat protein
LKKRPIAVALIGLIAAVAIAAELRLEGSRIGACVRDATALSKVSAIVRSELYGDTDLFLGKSPRPHERESGQALETAYRTARASAESCRALFYSGAAARAREIYLAAEQERNLAAEPRGNWISYLAEVTKARTQFEVAKSRFDLDRPAIVWGDDPSRVESTVARVLVPVQEAKEKSKVQTEAEVLGREEAAEAEKPLRSEARAIFEPVYTQVRRVRDATTADVTYAGFMEILDQARSQVSIALNRARSGGNDQTLRDVGAAYSDALNGFAASALIWKARIDRNQQDIHRSTESYERTLAQIEERSNRTFSEASENLSKALADFNAEQAALTDRYNRGEITQPEYNAAINTLFAREAEAQRTAYAKTREIQEEAAAAKKEATESFERYGRPEQGGRVDPDFAVKSSWAAASLKIDKADALYFAAIGERPPKTVGGVRVERITVAKAVNADHSPGEAATAFGKEDTVYVSMWTSNTPVGTEITARWYGPDGKQLTGDKIVTDKAGSGYTSFHAADTKGWAAGAYRVDILLNGAAAGSATFTIP